MKQFIFNKQYTEDLKKNVKEGNISAYGIDSFEFDPDARFQLQNDAPEGLLNILLENATPSEDYNAAIALYENYEWLNREQASYDPFWAHLTHVDFYQYMVKRFCNGNKPSLTDVKINWMHSNLMRRGLSNLWWSVKQSVDETHLTDKYHYTKYLFKHLDFRQRRLGSSTLFRHKEAVIGMLKFLEENVTDYFEGRANFITMYFNKQATLKQLATLNRDGFYNELVNIQDDIMKVKHREEAADAVNSVDDENWE